VSPSWRNDLTVAVGSAGLEAFAGLARGARVTAVLSSHHVRYALLPWSENLGPEHEWEAFARHSFAETYGAGSGNWDVQISSSPKGAARVACAVDAGFLAELRQRIKEAGAKLYSVQPGLMHAFNVRRREFRRESGWLVAAEEGRLTLALIVKGVWELVRVRNVGPRWQEELGALLRREEAFAQRDAPVERVVMA
jgi:hypothetical protein